MKEFSLYSYTKNELSLMPSRTRASNKGTYGRVLCVCGSAEMSGAAYLCAKAAYRTGAGLVEILTHENNRAPLSSLLPEAIISTYSDSFSASAVREAVLRADAVVVGCGLGRSLLSKKVLCAVLPAVRNNKKPCVIDADALNIISLDGALRTYMRGTIITPHPLEFSRISGVAGVNDIVMNAPSHAYAFSRDTDCVCVLKTHETAVADCSERVYVNNCGNSGMATGGSGDVLAGIIGGILAQKKSTQMFDLSLAATLGVYIHALAGDVAADELGEYSLMASDIIDAIPNVLKNL